MALAVGITDVDICARALVLLGVAPIQSMQGDDDKSVTCRTVYPMVKREVFSLYPWRFTVVKARLARLSATPTNEFKYAFQLPSDRLGGPRTVFDNGNVDAQPFRYYDIYQDQLYANSESIWIDYQADQDENKMPPYVENLMVFVAAARLAEPVTEDSSKGQKYDVMAYGLPGEMRGGGYFAMAKALDSQQRPSQQFPNDYDLLKVRG